MFIYDTKQLITRKGLDFMDADINELKSRITGFLSRGPNFIVDISENIEKDTMQTAAILDYFVARGEISKTERKFGTSPVYFLEKDRDAALSRLLDSLNPNERAIISKIKSAGVAKLDELSPMERYLIQGLGDFIKKITAADRDTGRKVDYIYYYKLSLDDIRNIINPPAKEQKTVAKLRQKTVEPLPKASAGGEIALLEQNGFTDPEKVDKGVYLCSYGPHALKVIASIIEKSPLKKKDIAKVAGYSSAYKTVAFILTKTDKVSGKKPYGNSINIIKIG